jgi:hypothetical protein
VQSNVGAVILRAGAAYFAVVFGAGFMLGLIRVLWALPRFGERIAELMEAPVMLVVIVVTARWVVQTFAIASGSMTRLGIGVFALSIMIIVEFTLVLKLRGLSIPEYIQSRDPIAGTVYLVMLLIFAMMPTVVEYKWIRQTNAGNIRS